MCVECFSLLSELMLLNLMNASCADISELLCDRVLTKTFTTLEKHSIVKSTSNSVVFQVLSVLI